MPATLEPMLNEIEAAKLLGVQPQTLALWRSTNRYALPFVRVGRCVRYRPTDLAAFLEARTVRPAELAN